MSIGGNRPGRTELPRQWERLERLAEEAAVVVGLWKRRALEAEEEVLRLRRALEDLVERREHPADSGEELLRLRAENAALHSRMLQARKRVQALVRRMDTLEVDL